MLVLDHPHSSLLSTIAARWQLRWARGNGLAMNFWNFFSKSFQILNLLTTGAQSLAGAGCRESSESRSSGKCGVRGPSQAAGREGVMAKYGSIQDDAADRRLR